MRHILMLTYCIVQRTKYNVKVISTCMYIHFIISFDLHNWQRFNLFLSILRLILNYINKKFF